jgi:hypothetical protein
VNILRLQNTAEMITLSLWFRRWERMLMGCPPCVKHLACGLPLTVPTRDLWLLAPFLWKRKEKLRSLIRFTQSGQRIQVNLPWNWSHCPLGRQNSFLVPFSASPHPHVFFLG